MRNVYWRKAGPDMPLLLVVIKPLGYRLRKGSKLLYRQPAFLICTDPQLDLPILLQAHIDRWEIECNRPPAPVSGSHRQLAPAGFHPRLRISAHRHLPTTSVMETTVDSPFDPRLAESAARPNLRSPHAG
ncbi:MAG: hypothetical protein LAP87_29645 [Acidobacteriia bacterium]|nr:hypothetical protein [Terriglobia bacterium]